MAYYNSNLSKYIGQTLKRTFTSIDVDILQIKASRNVLRFIESKHENEKLGDQQESALKTIAWIARLVNTNSAIFNGKRIDVYMVRGNPPYEEIIIRDFVSFRQYKLSDKKKIDGFLSVDYDLTESDIMP
jgi:hypothetical protein